MSQRKLIKLIVGLTLVIFFVVGCNAPAAMPSAPTATSVPKLSITPSTPKSVSPTVQNYKVVQDISYQKDDSDNYAQERGKLDIYLPEDSENFPVLVWFHGGALKYESKEESYATSVAKRFASEGIGVVLPNYRLSPRVKYPTYIEDAASAVAWVHQNINNYQGSPEQLFVGGHSSGAYLAAMIAMDEHYLEKHHLTSQNITGVIPISGEMFGDSTVWAEHGIYKARDETTVDETAPMFHVRRDVPPLLSMCAENENLCDHNQKFVAALRATGHENVTFKEIPGRTHFSISRLDSPDDPVVKLMLTFMQQAIVEEG